jgi:hypothetical protein
MDGVNGPGTGVAAAVSLVVTPSAPTTSLAGITATRTFSRRMIRSTGEGRRAGSG